MVLCYSSEPNSIQSIAKSWSIVFFSLEEFVEVLLPLFYVLWYWPVNLDSRTAAPSHSFLTTLFNTIWRGTAMGKIGITVIWQKKKNGSVLFFKTESVPCSLLQWTHKWLCCHHQGSCIGPQNVWAQFDRPKPQLFKNKLIDCKSFFSPSMRMSSSGERD